jgi:predicted AAA+ superfamily ATPase
VIYRTEKNILQNRILNEPRAFLQVVYGPRQIGKTTLVSQIINDISIVSHFASADAVLSGQQTWIEQQWETARIKLNRSDSAEGLLILDEIQKIENWSEVVKKEWDTDSKNNIPLKVILLGSSRLMLQQGLTESLAGRFENTYLGHWSYSEMKEAFGISEREYVWFGGYPGAAELFYQEERWKKYIRDSLIDTIISKDILMLNRVEKPALMKRLFELGCEYSGQILSYNKMLGQLQDAGNTTTLSHYLHLLDTAGLLGGIEKFSPNLIRQRASSPKFQVHNTAFISALSSYSLDEITAKPDIWGRWVESAIGAHLLNASLSEDFSLKYWRHRNDEIDFVLEKNEKVIGIEVKSGKTQTAKGMEAFKKEFNPHKILLVGKTGLPWEEFLAVNPATLF